MITNGIDVSIYSTGYANNFYIAPDGCTITDASPTRIATFAMPAWYSLVASALGGMSAVSFQCIRFDTFKVQVADDESRRSVVHMIKMLASAMVHQPCQNDHVGITTLYCGTCGENLMMPPPKDDELVNAIRKRIAAIAAPAPHMLLSTQNYIAPNGDGKLYYETFSDELDRARARIQCRAYDKLVQHVGEVCHRTQRAIIADESYPSEIIRLDHVDDARLNALHQRLAEPIFVYGAKCDIALTLKQLENLCPALTNKIEPCRETLVDRRYTNIHCLIKTLYVHASILAQPDAP